MAFYGIIYSLPPITRTRIIIWLVEALKNDKKRPANQGLSFFLKRPAVHYVRLFQLCKTKNTSITSVFLSLFVTFSGVTVSDLHLGYL